MSSLRTVRATRYATPLREGGSLPGVVEADDDGMYVVKFRGAGQGLKVLIAEVIVGEIGRTLGLPVPELVVVQFDRELAAPEPDPEIQELLERSAGTNFGMDFLPGALALGNPATAGISPELAAEIVWFDALTTNVDRTPRNPNMLLWGKRPWLIDHGAALYRHHGWTGKPGEIVSSASARFAPIRDHVLLPIAGSIPEAGFRLADKLDAPTLNNILDFVPDEWLTELPPFADPDEHRAAYREFFARRLEAAADWVDEAETARRAMRQSGAS